MTDDIATIRAALAAGPTPGPWHVDTMLNEGEYGNNGPDTRSGFDSYVLIDDDGLALADSLNRAGMASEVVECDEAAWDERAKRDFDFIAACSPDRITRILAALEAAQADAVRYRAWRAAYTNHDPSEPSEDMLLAISDAWSPAEVDAAIDDAAIAAEPPQDATPSRPTDPAGS